MVLENLEKSNPLFLEYLNYSKDMLTVDKMTGEEVAKYYTPLHLSLNEGYK